MINSVFERYERWQSTRPRFVDYSRYWTWHWTGDGSLIYSKAFYAIKGGDPEQVAEEELADLLVRFPLKHENRRVTNAVLLCLGREFHLRLSRKAWAKGIKEES